MEFKHTSVLLDETIENLNIKPNGVYMDGTLGGAGHSREIAKRLGSDGHLIGIDQDGEAIATAKERLAEYGDRITVVRDNYQNFKSILDELNISQVDGILLDLGVSSYQLDNADRGFTYRVDAPLDMRMDDRQTKTAKDIVNGYTEQELFHILKEYGEERFAKSIAYHIVKYRENKEIETTEELNDIIRGSIPAKVRNAQGHPSKQTFQAIRIELNHELEVLTNSIDGMIDCLKPGGRLCIITFHSLEDRIVKILPHSSLVGMLFETSDHYKVVESKTFGLLQHDPFTWLLDKGEFIYVKNLSALQKKRDEALNDWVCALPVKDRKIFVDTLYQVISASHAENLIDFTADWKKSMNGVVGAMKEIDADTKQTLKKIIKLLFEIMLERMAPPAPRRPKKGKPEEK